MADRRHSNTRLFARGVAKAQAERPAQNHSRISRQVESARLETTVALVDDDEVG
jgi:hypothetical protein